MSGPCKQPAAALQTKGLGHGEFKSLAQPVAGAGGLAAIMAPGQQSRRGAAACICRLPTPQRAQSSRGDPLLLCEHFEEKAGSRPDGPQAQAVPRERLWVQACLCRERESRSRRNWGRPSCTPRLLGARGGDHRRGGDGQSREAPGQREVAEDGAALRFHRARRRRWKCEQVTFCGADEQLCHLWLQALREQLDKLTCRPKRLLVFINPFGGKGQGLRIYERKVAPLFALAAISTEVIVTERANHAKEALYEMSVDGYDGGVCVGGDGMFSEVLHGLIGRTQRMAGVDQNEPRAALVPCPLRIGIIPAGSTDCVCYSTVGINDAKTSALHIIVGDSLPMDVSSVHHHGALLRYSVSLLGYGFYGDIVKDSEKKRWMGLIRYDFSGLKTFLSHHCYEGTVSFLPAQHTVGSPRDGKPCRAGCFVCRQSKQQLEEEQKWSLYGLEGLEEVEEWKVICGKFLAINAANMSCACPRSPRGLSPAAHLGDGSSDLILIRKCSWFNFLRFLVRHTNQDDQFDFTFVEVYRIKKFQFLW
ncbi:PREDICTED: ceramide kinase [Myotis davidii]|uniref:ceramide kinase n=1 Tax=Myotis davidii TaxID=225400 RepID=UPI0007679227|nr:PREDICTED: ceramide kinase [Myotis davidii]